MAPAIILTNGARFEMDRNGPSTHTHTHTLTHKKKRKRKKEERGMREKKKEMRERKGIKMGKIKSATMKLRSKRCGYR